MKTNVVFVGLHLAGKSSIKIFLESFDVNKALNTKASTKVEELRRRTLNLFIIPGQKMWRYDERLYKLFLPKAHKICFVVDAADHEKFDEVRRYYDFLMKMVKKYACETVELIVLAHKQDLPNAVSGKKIAELLGVNENMVLETSIFNTTSIARLYFLLVGIQQSFLDFLVQLMRETNAKAIFLGDLENINIAIGDTQIAVDHYVQAVELKKHTDYDYLILSTSGKTTCYFWRDDTVVGLCEGEIKIPIIDMIERIAVGILA